MIVNNSEQLSLHTNAILELWLELQIHYMKYTRNVRFLTVSKFIAQDSINKNV